MKKKQLLKEVFQQLDFLNIEFIKMRERESLQKLMDKETTEILEKQLDEPKPDSFKQLTEAENKAQVLFMREEWEAKKKKQISEAHNERKATSERERARWSLYNKGVLESTDKSNEQTEADVEFEDTSEPEPYIQKEQTKEEEEADFLAVRKQIDSQLKGIRDKQNEYIASNHNGA